MLQVVLGCQSQAFLVIMTVVVTTTRGSHDGHDLLQACANPSASSRTCGGATALQAS